MNKAFLFELLQTGSVSGNEAELEKKIYDYMQDKADRVTCLGKSISQQGERKIHKVLYR